MKVNKRRLFIFISTALLLVFVFSSVLIAVVLGIIARIKKNDFYDKKIKLKNEKISF